MGEVLIHRADRKRGKFTTIQNALLYDKRLTWRGRDVAHLILAQRPDFKISAERLAALVGESPHQIRRGLRELREAGYLTYIRGSRSGTKVHFHECLQNLQERTPEASGSGAVTSGNGSHPDDTVDFGEQGGSCVSKTDRSNDLRLEELRLNPKTKIHPRCTDVHPSQGNPVEGGRSTVAVREMSNLQLANYFMDTALRVAVRDYGARPVGPVNRQAIAKLIKTQREATGLTDVQIMRMMDTYVTQPQNWNPKSKHPAFDFASGNTWHRLRNMLPTEVVETPVSEQPMDSADRAFYAEMEARKAADV